MANGKSRALFKSPIVDWCKLMDGGSNNNALIRMFISSVKSYAPEFIHNCPYSGVHAIHNTTFLKNLVGVLPKGEFKLKAELFGPGTEVLQFETSFSVYQT